MELDTILGVTSVTASAIAAYLSYRIYTYNRLAKAWMAMTVAFIISMLLRIYISLGNYGLYVKDPTIAESVRTVISLIFIVGMVSMLKSFESFDIVEKKTKDKLRRFK